MRIGGCLLMQFGFLLISLDFIVQFDDIDTIALT